MFIITVTYLKPLSDVDQHLSAHREFLKKGYEQKLLLASGPQNPRTGGIIIARGNDRKKVLEFLAQDPFKQNGIAEYQLTEFEPVLFAEEIKNILK